MKIDFDRTKMLLHRLVEQVTDQTKPRSFRWQMLSVELVDCSFVDQTNNEEDEFQLQMFDRSRTM